MSTGHWNQKRHWNHRFVIAPHPLLRHLWLFFFSYSSRLTVTIPSLPSTTTLLVLVDHRRFSWRPTNTEVPPTKNGDRTIDHHTSDKNSSQHKELFNTFASHCHQICERLFRWFEFVLVYFYLKLPWNLTNRYPKWRHVRVWVPTFSKPLGKVIFWDVPSLAA